ncbi:MAG: UvrD-helicase domain-containing protein [Oscillospiraceae bacterium]|nr:UvrD-helicase domain-containing protein [Oscillospiraceae bacterium]
MTRIEFEKEFINLRTEAIACDFLHLNEVQRNAALTTQGALLLLAGAGSGKTTVLINRIANILKYGSASDSDFVPSHINDDDLAFLKNYIQERKNSVKSSTDDSYNTDLYIASDEIMQRVIDLCSIDPTPPWRIIAITFTNKAARELKERLERMLGSQSEDIWAMTFHSACSRILRSHIDYLGYSRDFTIYDTADTISLMKRIQKDLDIDDRIMHHRTILNYISQSKDQMLMADDFYYEIEKSGDIRQKLVARAYLEYENRMKASNALDFDDLILLTVRLLQENTEVLHLYQNRFKYVLIDEYQDTNYLQYLLASALAGGHGNICVVGDDDQSIYKFRGATIENILSFENNFKNAKTIRLEQNYRSTANILKAAGDVIRNNKGRKGKELWTNNEAGTLPELHIVSDERAEASLVADMIIESVAQGQAWQDHAILYRMNAQSNQFETAFKRAGIPYRVIGGTGFYERAEIKDMLAYLCVINNPNDDIRLLRIINKPPRGIGNTTIARLTELAADMGTTLFETIYHSARNEELKSAAGRLHIFADMIIQLQEAARNTPLDELYDLLLNLSGYAKMLSDKDTIENATRLENVRELKTNILSFMREYDNEGTLFDFLSETALYTDQDQDDNEIDRVNIMTMHSAKGLEFHTVFIVGAEEGVFPSSRVIGNYEEIEEERRLCYVAMTRAMRNLYFVSAYRRMLFGKTSSAQTSRFVEEIGSGNIEIQRSSSFSSNIYEERSYSVAKKSNDVFTNEDRASDSDSELFPFSSSNNLRDKDIRPSKGQNSQIFTDYKKGDMINHKSFGKGVITKIEAVGGDALVEIAFDEVGTKYFMLKAAAVFMEKI